MKTSKGYAFQTCYNKESATITCILAETARQARNEHAQ